MFMGSYDHSLDAKGRVIIPSKFREALGEKFVITNSLDPCLCVYDMASWERFVQKLSGLPYNTRKQRELVRFFMSNAVEVEPDKQGRILIPANLREYAGLTKDVTLVGVTDHVEVWDEKAWNAYNDENDLTEILSDLENVDL